MLDTLWAWLQVGLLVGLLYAPVTLGLAWSFRVLNYPDLTCEGSFLLAGAVSIAASNKSGSIVVGVFAGAVAACLAGVLTSSLHVFFRIGRLLSGIISWSILYSISLRVLGGMANLASEKPTIFSGARDHGSSARDILIAFTVTGVLTILTIVLGMTRWGRIARAYGDQPWFAVGLGYSPSVVNICGVTMANFLIGASGILLCQFRRVCDVSMSSGILVAGLASLVLGEAAHDARHFWKYIVTVLAGTILYNLAISLFYFDWGIGHEKIFAPSDVRFVSGLLLLIPAAAVARKKGRYRLFAAEW